MEGFLQDYFSLLDYRGQSWALRETNVAQKIRPFLKSMRDVVYTYAVIPEPGTTALLSLSITLPMLRRSRRA